MNGLKELLRDLQMREHCHLWVLIDAAGLPDGRASIDETRFVRLECLFTGDLAIELVDVAPYLGLLDPDDSSIEELLEYLIGIDCAVLLTDVVEPELTFSQAHRHLRKFNVVYGPDGKPLFFRYYDPRVLPNVLKVLDPEQLAAFVGPFESIALQGPEKSGLIRLQMAGQVLLGLS